MSDCILGTCPHHNGICQHLGSKCGARNALALAQRPKGYLIIAHDNPTIDGLVRAGLVVVERAPHGSTGVAYAMGS
jgi:hypothetical protein